MRRFAAVKPNPYVVDSLLALLSAGVSAWAVHNDEVAWPWWVYLLAVSTAIPLLWRRRFPAAALLACGVPNAALAIVAHSTLPQIQPYVVIAIYTVADRGKDWQRWSILAVLVVSNVLGTHGLNGLLFNLLIAVGSFVFGSLVRELRRLAALEADRAHQISLRAESDAARAVAEERSRIAREMHDILAHAVALMVIQAEAGPLVVHRNPERAIKAFDTIADSGRDAMVQLRRVLGVLKEDGGGPELAPQPTLDELPGVVERVRRPDLAVELELIPGEGAVPVEVGASAVRIVQEALTNAVKHSGADRIEVRVVRAGPVLEVSVADNGTGVPARGGPWSGGRGLVGIRERAAACGGRAVAGPVETGTGFAVVAELPLGGVA